MKGLKNVRIRRTDALTQVRWDQLESLLAVYYREQGYAVDHCGTGASGTQFDGGIDLKLRKDNAYIIIQCKHWNAKQVPHNPVHELIGVMSTQGATGAIFVTSGEYTRAAIEAAAKQGNVQLIDGDDLRAMLGPLPDAPHGSAGTGESQSMITRAASTIGERLLSAAEDRSRHGSHAPSRRRGAFANAMGAGLWIVVLKLLLGLVVLLVFTRTLDSVIGSLPGAKRAASVPAAGQVLPVPQDVSAGGVLQQVGAVPGRQPELIDHYTGTTIEDRPAGMPNHRQPTAEEVRESRRRADEASRIIEASTPEM
jgi:restriction system protein